jgi:hypothetical protein
MRQAGAIRISEEQELHVVRRQLQHFPEAMQAVMQAAHMLRRLVTHLRGERPAHRVMAAQPLHTGECLCGGVRYEFRRTATRRALAV